MDELGDVSGKIRYLGVMLGVALEGLNRKEAIPAQLLRQVRPHPGDPRALRACELARSGLSIRDIIAHGPINYHPVALGTPEQIADLLEQWFKADIGGGFNITPDSGLSGLTDFVEQVIPILQKRGLFRQQYENSTLRGHLGLPYRNGQ